jgi:hypothetical protein
VNRERPPIVELRAVRYVTTRTITVEANNDQALTIPANTYSDGYTLVMQTPDPLPAIAHDYAYTTHRWDSGDQMTRWQADNLLLFLMQSSKSRTTRNLARIYYNGVRAFGGSAWKECKPVERKHTPPI